ncbi:MAG: hypothetical protein ACO1PW_10830, partial [Actinomycetota bacterium]
ARPGELVAQPDGTDDATPSDDAAPAPVDPILWARALRAAGRVSGTYDAARRLIPLLTEAAEIARELGEPALEGHLRLHLAQGHGYDGDLAAALAHVARLDEIAADLGNPYVPLAVESLRGLAAMVEGDHAQARARLAHVAEALEALDAPSDAARIGRNLGVALRAAGQLDEALEALDRAERLALRARARGLLATIRTDIADVQAVRGRAEPDVLRSALDAVLAVGNLRGAGVLRTRLGQLQGDPATVAVGVLELLDADQMWAAVSLAGLLELLPADHPLHEHGPAAVRTLSEGWGIPLDVEAHAVLERYRESAPAPLPDGWEGTLRAALRAVAQDTSGGQGALDAQST